MSKVELEASVERASGDCPKVRRTTGCCKAGTYDHIIENLKHGYAVTYASSMHADLSSRGTVRSGLVNYV